MIKKIIIILSISIPPLAWSMESSSQTERDDSGHNSQTISSHLGAFASSLSSLNARIPPIGGVSTMSVLTGIGSYQCYKIAQTLDPHLYNQVIDITQNAVDILIKNPAILKLLALKYDRRVLTGDELDKAMALLMEFRHAIHTINPALYVATGALAATSFLYAYHAVSNGYKFIRSPSTPPDQSAISLSPPFITLSPQKKVLLNMGCWGAATTIAGVTTYTCYKVDNLFEFDSWDIALNFLQSTMKDLHDNPKVLNLLRWWYNEDALKLEYLEQTQALVAQGRTLLEKAPAGLQIAKGAFAALTIYGVYKMVTCGYDYLKYKLNPPAPSSDDKQIK